jgi:hypothetical protein
MPDTPKDDTPEPDDGFFGIDLGPRGDRDDEETDEVPESPTPRPPNRTLSSRLAEAKADRDDSDARNEGGAPEAPEE